MPQAFNPRRISESGASLVYSQGYMEKPCRKKERTKERRERGREGTRDEKRVKEGRRGREGERKLAGTTWGLAYNLRVSPWSSR